MIQKINMIDKKIGILNFHFSTNNYGAVIQAYALQQHLILIGYNVENIDLKPNTFWKTKIFNFCFSSPFEKFRKRYLKVTKKSFYESLTLNKTSTAKYTHFIVGSDQVWRPSYCDFPKDYFLSFATNEQKKIAYAASFGIDHWEVQSSISEYQLLLQRFSAVSVRESTGVSLCKDVFNIEAKLVLDPTLLVDKIVFDRLIESNKLDEDRIVYYKLDQDDDFIKSINYLELKLNLNSTNIYYKEVSFFGVVFKKFKKITHWLASLKNAKLIVTDSFHCICFAIIFNKNFIYYLNKKNRGLTRVQSLFTLLNIKDKIVIDFQDLSKNEKLFLKLPDYESVNSIIKEQKKISSEFLIKAIN